MPFDVETLGVHFLTLPGVTVSQQTPGSPISYNLSGPSSTMSPLALCAELFCKYIHWDLDTKFCIFIGYGFFYSGFCLLQREIGFFIRGDDYTYLLV